jgi:hypothetical protein
MLKQRLARTLAGALVAATPIAGATPASAATSADIGVAGTESRCASKNYVACIYYGGSINNAYLPISANLSDLSTHYFWQGTGTGENTNVENNAGAVFCASLTYSCTIYSGSDATGNYDYLFGGVGSLSGKSEVGKLSSLTYHHAGSIYFRLIK